MSTWARKNLNVVVYMRNRACSVRAPPVAAVTRMMTAKCVGTNRKATITNMMTRALNHPRRDKMRRARAASRCKNNSCSSSVCKARGNHVKRPLQVEIQKPVHIKRLRPGGSGLNANNRKDLKKKKPYKIKIQLSGSTTGCENKVKYDVSDRHRQEDAELTTL